MGPARGKKPLATGRVARGGLILEADFSRRPKPTSLRRRHPVPFFGKPREGAGRKAQASAPPLVGPGLGVPVEVTLLPREPGRQTLRGHEVSHLGGQLKNCSAQPFHPLGSRPCSELGDNYKTSNRRLGADVKNQQWHHKMMKYPDQNVVSTLDESSSRFQRSRASFLPVALSSNKPLSLFNNSLSKCY